MKKKIISIALVLALVLTAGTASAFAAQVVVSPQKLIVNNVEVKCEVYNIDGSNYFKLRDIAYMLKDTPGRFSVDWDDTAKTISVTIGSDYIPAGGELVTGEDKSATAIESPQKLLVNDELIDGFSVYNIGGNNFFKLRDMGKLLGFEVDYDQASKTMIVNSYGPREASDISEIKAVAGEQLQYDNKIFSGDVTVTGTVGNVSFTNCEFKGNIINKATGSTLVYIDSSCSFDKNSELIISNDRKEADVIKDGFPKFGVSDGNVNIVCKDCFGTAIAFGKELKFNGKIYTAADITSYYDTTDNKLIPYTGQATDVFLVCQYWENGEKQILVVGQ